MIHISPNFPHLTLTTRKGTNRHSKPVYSRLNYILTNEELTINTKFMEDWSDHIFFNVNLELKESSVRRVLSFDRKQINRELAMFVNTDIT